MKEAYESNNIKLDKKFWKQIKQYLDYDSDINKNMAASLNLKAIAYAITVMKSVVPTNEDVQVKIGLKDEDVTAQNTEFKTAGVDMQLPLKQHMRYAYGSAKKTEKSQTDEFWLSQFTKNGLEIFYWLKYAKSIGVTMQEKGDRIYYTIILSNMSQNSLNKNKMFNKQTLENINKVQANIKDVEESNTIRKRQEEHLENYAQKCAADIEEDRTVWFNRKRPAFNHYNILGELSLMREYPDVLYHWLDENKEFKKNSPHATDIQAYLKTAEKRPNIGAKCVLRDSCAWTFSYINSVKGPDHKFGPFGNLDLNYLDHTYEMNMHLKSRMSIIFAKTYQIDNILCNDFGVYDLIVHLFLNEKDPSLWKRLLKWTGGGIDSLAMTTSKSKNKWNVTLIFYKTLQSENCPPSYFNNAPKIGFQSCLNKYNFYQRRWHDYDWTKGVIRKPGEDETGADKPKPGDLPIDNVPRPPIKPITPPTVVKPGPPEKKKPTPVVPKKPTPKPVPNPNKPPANEPKKEKLPKKPETKDPTLTPEQIREHSDKEFEYRINSDSEVKQVITLSERYNWLVAAIKED